MQASPLGFFNLFFEKGLLYFRDGKIHRNQAQFVLIIRKDAQRTYRYVSDLDRPAQDFVGPKRDLFNINTGIGPRTGPKKKIF
jgi:hypothetical protein